MIMTFIIGTLIRIMSNGNNNHHTINNDGRDNKYFIVEAITSTGDITQL